MVASVVGVSSVIILLGLIGDVVFASSVCPDSCDVITDDVVTMSKTSTEKERVSVRNTVSVRCNTAAILCRG